MRVNKDAKGTKYVPYPVVSYPQAIGFRIESDLQAFSRALGIETGFASYYQGARGSFKMIRKDLATILNHDPLLIFTFDSDMDVRKYYQKHYGTDMDDWYAKHDPVTRELKFKGRIVALRQYPAYVSIHGIQQELALKEPKSTERMLKEMHRHYGIDTLYSITFHRQENSCNRVVLYRKEIAHLLLYPNIGDGIKVKLMEQEGTWENLVSLAEQAGVYALYPYNLRDIAP